MRRALNEIRAQTLGDRISRNDAADRVGALVERLGLRPIELAEIPEVIEEDDVAVVCWMTLLPPE